MRPLLVNRRRHRSNAKWAVWLGALAAYLVSTELGIGLLTIFASLPDSWVSHEVTRGRERYVIGHQHSVLLDRDFVQRDDEPERAVTVWNTPPTVTCRACGQMRILANGSTHWQWLWSQKAPIPAERIIISADRTGFPFRAFTYEVRTIGEYGAPIASIEYERAHGAVLVPILFGSVAFPYRVQVLPFLGNFIFYALPLFFIIAAGREAASRSRDWIIRQLTDDTPRCRKCGYNLRGLTGAVCPECGHALPPPPTRPHPAFRFGRNCRRAWVYACTRRLW